MGESVDALQRAIAVLKKQAFNRKQQQDSLAQVSVLKMIPAQAKLAIEAFIQNGDEPDEGMIGRSAPDAHGYEFQSHGVVDMLEKLLDKFIDERTATEKEEMNKRHAHDMLMQDLNAQTDQAKSDSTKKSTTKAKKMGMKADAEGDLSDTSATKLADEKYLSDLTATCQQKATDFESRQQLRGEELDAINKAIEIISGGSVAGHAEKHLPGLLQIKARPTSFAQLRTNRGRGFQEKASEFLSDRAKMLNSRILSAL